MGEIQAGGPDGRGAIPSNLATVERRIAQAAQAAHRDRREITLIAVAKTFTAGEILPVLGSGQVDFGENRVQEAKAKWPELKRRFPQTKLHLVGPLQSNKAAEAIALFDAIHAVDRPKLARIIADEIEKQNRQIELFIQVNTGQEPQKTGVAPEDADQFIDFCRSELRMKIAGLMCVPPLEEEPERHFSLLSEIGRRNGLAHLSMGMSADLEKAILLGATHVRVGTAIFGSRGEE